MRPARYACRRGSIHWTDAGCTESTRQGVLRLPPCGSGRSLLCRHRAGRARIGSRSLRALSARSRVAGQAKWSLSGRVVAGLLKAGHEVSVFYSAKGLTRPEALVAERGNIARLVASGHALANIQHNPQRCCSAQQVIDAVLARLR